MEHMKISMGRMSASGTLPCGAKEGIISGSLRLQGYCLAKTDTQVLSRSTDLACRLVQAERVSEFFFTDSTRCINLVAKDQEGNL